MAKRVLPPMALWPRYAMNASPMPTMLVRMVGRADGADREQLLALVAEIARSGLTYEGTHLRFGTRSSQQSGACRTCGSRKGNRPQRGQFLTDLPAQFPVGGQRAQAESASVVGLQPMRQKLDRLLAMRDALQESCGSTWRLVPSAPGSDHVVNSGKGFGVPSNLGEQRRDRLAQANELVQLVQWIQLDWPVAVAVLTHNPDLVGEECTCVKPVIVRKLAPGKVFWAADGGLDCPSTIRVRRLPRSIFWWWYLNQGLLVPMPTGRVFRRIPFAVNYWSGAC